MWKTRINHKIISLCMTALILLSSASLAFAEGTTVYTPEALKKAVYNQMVARNNSFSISYVGSEVDSITENAQNFFKEVYTGSDDYLKWNRSRFYFKYSQLENRIDFNFEINYLTTKAQEAYVDTRVSAILQDIILPQMNDYEKLIAIHTYICNHVTYDRTLTKFSAYNALADGEAVCQGYALLMDKMLERVGIKTIIIDGTIPEGPHAWNLVQIEGAWYHVDATNNDGNMSKYLLKTDQYMKSQGYSWNGQLFPPATKTFVVPLKVTVMVDGKLVEFDAQPYINQDNRTMVPVRFVSERLGAEVTWDSDTRSVIIENRQTRLIMTIDSNTVMQDGTANSMDTTAIIRHDRTMVPLRFISEYLGATVDWDDVNLTANIYSVGYAVN